MLATESARHPPDRDAMASSFHHRGHQNGSSASFGSSNMTSSSGRYGSGSTMNSGFTMPPPSHAALSPPPPDYQQINGNIMNRRAGADSSLYQICLNLRKRLAEVPNFQPHLEEMDEEEADANDATDPVTAMWNCLRRGFPLMTIYNAFNRPIPLKVDSNISEAKMAKHAAFKFLQACMSDLKFPPQECFLITDLYGENTTGFVKVTKVVNRVLDILQKQGCLIARKRSTTSYDPSRPQTQTIKQKIVSELIDTERDYINHLENLQQFKKELEQNGALSGDAIHDIFLNLDSLLEFQRRFQVRLEQQFSSPEATQQWGKVFYHYYDGFMVYVAFIANQQQCQKTVSREWDKLKNATISPELHGIVETQSVLLGFLSKPFQRLTKYPMLLDELNRKGGFDPERARHLEEGAEKIRSILADTNNAIKKEERLEATMELQERVEDWKGHKIDHFGDLLLYGNYTVLKGEGAKEVEREYKVYLFERILLCCKEMNPNKPKNMNRMLANSRPLVDKKGKLKLQLKGRIFMQNVTDVLTMTKSDRSSFTVQIFWKGDPGVENFVIRFPSEEIMVEWRETVQAQKKFLSENRGSTQKGTSATEFEYMRNQPAAENPYREEDDVEEEGAQAAGMNRSMFPMSRNASNNSLRSVPPQHNANLSRTQKRMQHHDQMNGIIAPPLSLNTDVPPGANSPGDFAGNSYFSPSNDSPISTRSSSSQASIYAFTRQAAVSNGWPHENSKHRTAPALGRDGRAPSREGYARPSLPPMAASQYPGQIVTSVHQSRSRSTSTPIDPNRPVYRSQQSVNGQQMPPSEPVPAIPHTMRTPINRSQTTSPIHNQLPIRNSNAASSGVAAGYDPRGQRLTSRGDAVGPRHGPVPFSNPELTPTSSMSDEELPYPPQIKVKIWYDSRNHYVTIVVGNNIKYATLADRIDSKMVKITSQAISKCTAKLIYKDADGDFLSIRSDDDVQMAIEDWGMRNEAPIREKTGLVDDFELIWQETTRHPA